MNRLQRQALIVEHLAAHGEVTVADLCKRFETSEMTIRRDLADMDRAGLLRRVHGGAIAAEGRSYEPPFSLRSTQERSAKEAIAARALSFIDDGDSVALDVGSTVLALAPLLAQRRGLTIVTASLPVAQHVIDALTVGRDCRLIITGGETRAGELSMVGDLAQRTYREFHVDKAFLGIGGVSLDDGLTDYNVEDALVKRELLKSAKNVFVLAHGAKFGRTRFAAVGPLDHVAAFVTDRSAPPDVVAGLAERGHEVHVVAGD
ncbi:MAG: DeoR/GlpR family DNA-binding transcription regulator [Actinomycetota bacterium]|nr:DeoR/GlpR family DNA-binding transcription regulator [Actinomycetota bacterium]